MKPRLTEWFGPEVKPTIPGVYELEDLPAAFHHFDGKKWIGAWWNAAEVDVNDQRARHAPYMDLQRWRGLAEKPE